MTFRAQGTIRNAGMLLVQRVGFVASALLLVVLVPRLMGPDVYGRYALITSLGFWFVLSSSLGSGQVIARYAPQFVLDGDRKGLQQLFANLAIVRLLSGALAAGLYLVLTVLWLRDLDVWVLVILGGAVLVRSAHDLVFWLFVGLNQAARRGMGDLVRQWLLVVCLPIGFHLGRLQGACWGLLLTEVLVLCLGLAWARPYICLPNLSLDVRRLAPYVRFGLLSAASVFLIAAANNSGEALAQAVAGDYTQVAFFGLAYGAYRIANQGLAQVSMAFAPLYASFVVQDRTKELRQWAERLLKALAAGGMVVVLGAALLGHYLVPLGLGEGYGPVVANLQVLALALVTESLSKVGYVLSLACELPEVALASEMVRLVVFWTAGVALVTWQGSLGGCAAVLLASAMYSTYVTWRMTKAIRYSLRQWIAVIALGLPFLPLAWLRASFAVNAVVYGGVVTAYVGLLLAFRVFTLGELARLWQALVARESTSDAKGEGVLGT